MRGEGRNESPGDSGTHRGGSDSWFASKAGNLALRRRGPGDLHTHTNDGQSAPKSTGRAISNFCTSSHSLRNFSNLSQVSWPERRWSTDEVRHALHHERPSFFSELKNGKYQSFESLHNFKRLAGIRGFLYDCGVEAKSHCLGFPSLESPRLESHLHSTVFTCGV